MDFSENKKIQFKKGDLIFEEHSPGTEMFYILSGQINIYLMIHNKKEILTVLEAGQFFGELALFNESHRNASAEASIDSELLVITKDNLKSIILNNPDLTYQLIHTVSRHLERLTKQYEKALKERVEWDIVIK